MATRQWQCLQLRWQSVIRVISLNRSGPYQVSSHIWLLHDAVSLLISVSLGMPKFNKYVTQSSIPVPEISLNQRPLTTANFCSQVEVGFHMAAAWFVKSLGNYSIRTSICNTSCVSEWNNKMPSIRYLIYFACWKLWCTQADDDVMMILIALWCWWCYGNVNGPKYTL